MKILKLTYSKKKDGSDGYYMLYAKMEFINPVPQHLHGCYRPELPYYFGEREQLVGILSEHCIKSTEKEITVVEQLAKDYSDSIRSFLIKAEHNNSFGKIYEQPADKEF